MMTNKQARAILIELAENVLADRYEDEPLDLYYALELAIDALDETDKKPWYEWEWSEIIEESNFIIFPYEDYWVCRHKHAHDALAVGETRQGALDNCILVLRLSRDVERADNQEGAE